MGEYDEFQTPAHRDPTAFRAEKKVAPSNELKQILDEVEERYLDKRVPVGPWIITADDAEECGPHAHSGLAKVMAPQDARSLPWPPARLCEWPTAHFIKHARTDVPALHKIVKMYVEELTFHGRQKKLADLTAILNQGREDKKDLGDSLEKGGAR